MKQLQKNFSIVMLLTLTACGKQPPVEPTTVYVPVSGPQGSSGSKGDTGPSAQPTSAAPTFEGYYALENGGYADIYQDAQGLNTVRSLRLVMPNQDGSFGLVPVSNTNGLGVINETLYYNLNVAYINANNVKTDVGNNQLNATYLTSVKITKNNKTLQIKVDISTNSGVFFSHTVSSQ